MLLSNHSGNKVELRALVGDFQGLTLEGWIVWNGSRIGSGKLVHSHRFLESIGGSDALNVMSPGNQHRRLRQSWQQ